MPYSALQIAADLNVTGDRQTFVVSNPNESGTLAVKTTIEPTNALSVDTSISIRDLQENGVVLSYTSEENDADNIAKLSISKNGSKETVFTIDQNEIVKMLYALQAKEPVNDDDVATKKFVLDNAGSGGGGSGGVAQTYVDAQDTTTLNSAKSFTTTQLANYTNTTALNTTLLEYSKISDMQTADTATLNSAKSYTDTAISNVTTGTTKTYVDAQDTTTLNSAKSYTDTAIAAIPQGSSTASSLSSGVIVNKDSATNTSNTTYTAAQINTTFTNAQTFLRTLFPNDNYISTQLVGDNAGGVQLYCGTKNTLWIQIMNTGLTNNMLVKLPIRFEPTGIFNFEDTHLVTKAYTDSVHPIGMPVLVPVAPFTPYDNTTSLLWDILSAFFEYGQWRIPGDIITKTAFPVTYKRYGGTTEASITLPTLTVPNASFRYVYRVA